MLRLRPLFAAALLASALPSARAAEAPPKPLKVLLVCGGCCHDYTKQKDLIARGLAERAHIEVTAVQQGGTATNSKIPLYSTDDWYKGYDLVIHDECFSDVKEPPYTARILAPHKAGLPAVVLHCAMHSYRDGTDEWFKFLGVTSRRHGAGYPHEVLNVDPQHPVMAKFGPAWANPAGELYWIEKVWPTAHPLATS
ncbi:MAG TPA: ThuA domain-containing protein, partial [Isosphaeraceae bacterium]